MDGARRNLINSGYTYLQRMPLGALFLALQTDLIPLPTEHSYIALHNAYGVQYMQLIYAFVKSVLLVHPLYLVYRVKTTAKFSICLSSLNNNYPYTAFRKRPNKESLLLLYMKDKELPRAYKYPAPKINYPMVRIPEVVPSG